jgi:hypothetical protein
MSGMWLKRLLKISPDRPVGWPPVLTRDTQPPVDSRWQARFFTRSYEFDYVSWTVDAFVRKLSTFLHWQFGLPVRAGAEGRPCWTTWIWLLRFAGSKPDQRDICQPRH